MGLVATALCFGPPAHAGMFNFTLTNNTGNPASDYEVTVTAPTPINKTLTFTMGGDVSFPTVGTAGQGTNMITLTYSGAMVNNGQSTHVGAAFTPGTTKITVTASSFTFPAAAAVDVPLASAGFDEEGEFHIVEVKNFTSLAGTTLSALEFFEGTGDSAPLIQNFTGDTTFVSYAYFFSPTEIPLDMLNAADLTQFDSLPFTPIETLAPVPEPGTLTLLGAGLFGLWRRGKMRKVALTSGVIA